MKDTDPDINRSFFNKQECYEYNINDFNAMSKPDMFSTIHINIRSLPMNFDYLVIFLKLLNRNFSCIGISETWLSDISPIDTFNIPSYSFLCKSRNSKRGGGVCIYVHNMYNYKERTDLSIFDDGIFESIFVEMFMSICMSLDVYAYCIRYSHNHISTDSAVDTHLNINLSTMMHIVATNYAGALYIVSAGNTHEILLI